MPLKVFHGPFQPCLEDAFVERLSAFKPGPGRRLAVVAPSRRLADRLQRLLCVERGLSVLNVRFHTFFSLASEIAEEQGFWGKTLVGDGLFHDWLVDRILKKEGGKVSRGLGAAYRASLRDLIDGGVEPERYREHFGALLSPEENRRLEALFGLRRRYEETLEKHSILTPSALARRAAEAVDAGRAEVLKRYAAFFYYGFYDLTGIQADFFSAVAGAHHTELFFPYRQGHPAFAFAQRFFDLKLRGAEVSEREAPGTFDALFVPGRESGGALKVVSVSGARDEAWAAAKEILALREEGFAFEEMGIAARTIEPYRAVLAQVLLENEIPFSMEGGEPLLRHPIAKLCLAVLTLRSRDFPAASVLELVSSPYFRSPGPRVVGHWRRLVERLGVHSGWLQWEGKVSPCAKEDFELYPQAAAEGREGYRIPKEDSARLWSFLQDIRERLDPGRKDSWEGHGRRARSLLEEVFTAEDSSAWSRVLGSLQELSVFAAVSPAASWGEFLEALEEKLRRGVLEGESPRRGVRVADAMDARGDGFRALIVLGLTEGLFPRQVREDPLLPDSIRARLRHPGGYWISPKLEGYEEEKLLFFLLASSARERLVCVHQRSDEDGRACIPSVYLRELSRACPAARGARVARQPVAKLLETPAERLTPKELGLSRGASAESLLRALGRDGRLYADCAARLKALRRPGEPGEVDGVIGSPVALPESLSPTALDSFSACPFQFFASRVLGLREAPEPSERGELSPQTKGMLYHRILERFYSEPPGAQWPRRLEETISGVFAELGWRELGLYPLLWEASRRRMSRLLRAFVERDLFEQKDSGFSPARLERELSGTVSGLRLRGRPDRIDADAAGRLRVVDYKTRGRGSLERKVLSMQAHQPPLYLELAGAREGGAYYYFLEEAPELTGGEWRQEFAPEAWGAARGGILANVGKFARQMERGEFFIAPDDERGGACAYCDYSWLCRKAHPATRRRAEGSRLRAAFDAAHEVKG